MNPNSLTVQSRPTVTQRELLGLVLRCAARESASFAQAMRVTERASGDPDAAPLTRELLSDLAIRDWIELRRAQADGSEKPVDRLRYELELSDQRNWDRSARARTRYALTVKGREQVKALFSTLRHSR